MIKQQDGDDQAARGTPERAAVTLDPWQSSMYPKS